MMQRVFLSDMIINDDDSEVMKEIKGRILEIYNAKLLERYEKRKFVIENNIIDLKKVQAAERKRPKEDRDLMANFNVFMQLMPKPEFDEILNGLLEENATRRRIEELKHYRSIGLKTVHEIEQFENEKRKKEDKKGKIIAETVRARYGKDIKLEKGKKLTLLDISGFPCYDILSIKEREFCGFLRLYPQQYILIKETLVREYLKTGHVKRAVARSLVKIDVNKINKIFDFMECNGWINRTINDMEI